MGRLGRFQFGQTARLHRQTAEAIGHKEYDLGVVLDLEFADELLDSMAIPRIA